MAAEPSVVTPPPPAAQVQVKTWKGQHSLGVLLLLPAITLVALLSPPAFRLGAWLVDLVLLWAFILLVGHGATGLWRSWLVDDRYMMSLSRLQAVLWTVVVLSAFFVAALGNLATGEASALEVAIPAEIWLVMGISATSLVASPLIRSDKKKKDPEPQEARRTLRALAAQPASAASPPVTNQGLVLVNGRPEDASLSDLFRGEETGNGALLDLGKVQLFFFTVLIVLVYAAALGRLFMAGGAIHSFPALDDSTIALLGISHTAYLTNKAIPHSKTE